MDDYWPTLFMKTKITIATILFFLSSWAYSDDLLEIMQFNWDLDNLDRTLNSYTSDKRNNASCYCPSNDEENYTEEYGSSEASSEANGEHYSWDNLYLEPAYPEIIY